MRARLGVVLLLAWFARSPPVRQSALQEVLGVVFRGAVCSSAPLSGLESEELARSPAHQPRVRQSRLSHLTTIIGLRPQ